MEKGDIWEPFWFYYRPPSAVTFASTSVQDELKPQAKGSPGCYTRCTAWLLSATRAIFYIIGNDTKLSKIQYILVLSSLSFDNFLQGGFES